MARLPWFVVALVLSNAASAATLTGEAAFGDASGDAPGVRRLIKPADLPKPYATESNSHGSNVSAAPTGATPRVPDGFKVELFASGLQTPRTLRVAPNGDIFLAESGAGRVMVFRAGDGEAKPSQQSEFAGALGYPYGIAFYPSGPSPEWVYVASTNRIVRYPYRSGDLKARGEAEVVFDGIPGNGHTTRDIVFTPDGKRLLVAVGSRSNAGEGLSTMSPQNIVLIEKSLGLGAAWSFEEGRAAIIALDPQGKNAGAVFASGIRNCSGITVQTTGDIWCATNERDGIGDNLPPDYVSRIKEGAFYGWPWYYIGDNEDPRHAGERPDLKGKVTVPDVLIQPHSAPLGIVFYDGTAFPEEYRGDAFVTLHGSWNREAFTGYKVVRIVMKNGAPTGEYEDFMTGFVLPGDVVWGRPVGIAVAKDGALLVSEDGNGTIWRISPK